MTGSSCETCEGCCEAIYDRFVMRVGNLSWHEDCLFCSDCHTQLTSSCYFKENRLLCRMDYEKRFGVKCGRCGQFLSSQDLVMRTLHNVFHLHCFVCAVCCRPLTRGDQYIVRAGQVVCRADYEKEYFMVQGFSPPEMLQDGQQGMADDFVVESTGRQRDGRRGPKRPRTILTAAQRRQFKASFDVSPKPCRKVREALGKETGLSVRVVQVWFQNQRAKMKKMQRRGKLDKDGRKKEDGNKKGNNSSGGGGNPEGSGNSNASKKDNSDDYEDSIASNDAFSDDDESLVFDNLDDVDTPETVDHNIEGSSKHPTPSGNPNQASSSLQHPSGTLQQQNHPFGGGNYSGMSTPPGMVGTTNNQPLPAHLPIHPHPSHHQSHHPSSMNAGMPSSEAHSSSQPPPPPHHLHSENVLQNPIDKLYLMQDSYFTQM